MLGRINGTRIQQLGGRWGPYPTGQNNSGHCYVHVVKRLDEYKKLDPEFLVGVDINYEVRFICDIPDAITLNKTLFEYLRCVPRASKNEGNEETLRRLFEKVVQAFCG